MGVSMNSSFYGTFQAIQKSSSEMTTMELNTADAALSQAKQSSNIKVSEI